MTVSSNRAGNSSSRASGASEVCSPRKSARRGMPRGVTSAELLSGNTNGRYSDREVADLAGIRIALSVSRSAGAAPRFWSSPSSSRSRSTPPGSYSTLAAWCAQLSLAVQPPRTAPRALADSLHLPQSSTTNKPDVIKTKEEKVAEKSSSALKSFISGGAGGVAAVLVGASPSPPRPPLEPRVGVTPPLAPRTTRADRSHQTALTQLFARRTTVRPHQGPPPDGGTRPVHGRDGRREADDGA